MDARYGFQRVVAWQKAHAFVVLVYKVTRTFPDDERFGLTSQFRRAAVSIEANIAEGYKKISKADKLRFYNISQGSLEECRNYVILSYDLNYIDERLFDQLCDALEDASRLINAYCESIVRDVAMRNDYLK
jgi:four helix bundle protein